MKPLETLATDFTADGEELILYRRDGVYHLRVNGMELMSSRAHGSEDALARLACAGLADKPAPRILIGGLGFGYTLRAALDLLPRRAEVVVSEIFESLLAWHGEHLGELAGRPMADRRVEARIGDVRRLLDGSERFDVIILDVDNGPWAFTVRSNGGLYTDDGVRRLFRCLHRPGKLAVWSSDPAPHFERRLSSAGFKARTEIVPSRGSAGGPRHAIFVADRS